MVLSYSFVSLLCKVGWEGVPNERAVLYNQWLVELLVGLACCIYYYKLLHVRATFAQIKSVNVSEKGNWYIIVYCRSV